MDIEKLTNVFVHVLIFIDLDPVSCSVNVSVEIEKKRMAFYQDDAVSQVNLSIFTTYSADESKLF